MDLSYHWVSADLKNTKVEPCICTKHNARATKNLQKVFSKHNARKPEPRAYFFCLCKTAHFLIKRCTFSARGKFFRSGTTGQRIFRGSLKPVFKRRVGTPHGTAGLGKKEKTERKEERKGGKGERKKTRKAKEGSEESKVRKQSKPK